MHWWQRVSAGHLHLDRFESTFHNAHTSKKHHPSGWCFCWWGKVDSNHRSYKQQIYSLSPLATREFPHMNFVLKSVCMEPVDGLEPPTC